MKKKKELELAIKDAIQDHGGITKVAIESDVSRKQIGLITNGGNYNIETLRRLCSYFGFKIYIW